MLFLQKVPLFRTYLCQVAGVSTKAIRTDADECILSYPCHTCSSIMANIHLTVVTWINGKKTGSGSYKITFTTIKNPSDKTLTGTTNANAILVMIWYYK